MAVHLTRPKSSKGRRRSTKTLTFFQNNSESNPQQSATGSLVSAEFGVGGPDNQPRSQSRPEMRHSGYLSQNQIQQNELPDGSAAGQSLNKYKVLPSIEKEKGRSKLSHSENKVVHSLILTGKQILKSAEACGDGGHTKGQLLGTCSSKNDRMVALSPDTMLLAIKDPGGRRFEQCFHSSDTLLSVRASAEVTYGVKFGGNTTIETMEVPRRSFNDMSLTLAQCGISNKSVLCIFQQDE
ncbi:hypothetical protein NQD34_004992 [Periophthalmus magnuspinnatus]|uniref:UBX domain-containing protein 10 n=1 Tax=Periophthalmus magnuspinnatus TaxID=409849 RepID=UPI00145AB27C|nr:UBX domain-containing protein 10 [Periophthalmus magnuspinnatus]KAJ0036315.1 hypothetical protein NQD34_004992 [Periophthalmus magnuspinnatus]